jgi:hypothetical protein
VETYATAHCVSHVVVVPTILRDHMITGKCTYSTILATVNLSPATFLSPGPTRIFPGILFPPTAHTARIVSVKSLNGNGQNFGFLLPAYYRALTRYCIVHCAQASLLAVVSGRELGMLDGNAACDAPIRPARLEAQ